MAFAALEAKPNVLYIHPKKITLAFGLQGVPQLIVYLGSDDVDVVRNCLDVLNTNVLKVPKQICMFAKYKGVNKTVELTQRNDDSVAVPALQALHKCSANPNGRDGLLRANSTQRRLS